MERTEEQKVIQSPTVVVLGGQEYDIRILPINESREWRKKAAKVYDKWQTTSRTVTDASEGLANLQLVEMPEDLLDLFFAYAKDLDRESIESTATEAELDLAVQVVLEVGRPFGGKMTEIVGKMFQ